MSSNCRLHSLPLPQISISLSLSLSFSLSLFLSISPSLLFSPSRVPSLSNTHPHTHTHTHPHTHTHTHSLPLYLSYLLPTLGLPLANDNLALSPRFSTIGYSNSAHFHPSSLCSVFPAISLAGPRARPLYLACASALYLPLSLSLSLTHSFSSSLFFSLFLSLYLCLPFPLTHTHPSSLCPSSPSEFFFLSRLLSLVHRAL